MNHGYLCGRPALELEPRLGGRMEGPPIELLKIPDRQCKITGSAESMMYQGRCPHQEVYQGHYHILANSDYGEQHRVLNL